MRVGLIIASAFLIGCSSNRQPQVPALDPATAQKQADLFLATLYPDEDINGPICLPNEVIPGETQCQFSYQDEDHWVVGSLLCGNTGCREGQAPAVVAQDQMPPMTQAGGYAMDEEWLYWYSLRSMGGIEIELDFDSWKHKTPAAYRHGYYSHSFRPSAAAKTYYKKTYSTPISHSVSKGYSYSPSAKTSSGYKPAPVTSTPAYKPSTTTPSSGTGYKPSTSTTPTYKPSPAPSPKPTYKPAPSTRSSGYGTSRSTGGASSGGRRR